MTREMTRDELLRLLLVERFAPSPSRVPDLRREPPRIGRARLAAAMAEADRGRCLGCGTRVDDLDQPCPTCSTRRGLRVVS